jgi:uncharacterized protein (DUF362 family)
MKRRTFLLSAVGAAMTTGAYGAVFTRGRDVSYEPNQPLTSMGLRIEDGINILKKGEKGNIPPVLREEILDNPKAVFIINAGIQTPKGEKGGFAPCPDQLERFGNRVGDLVFRKGTAKGGRTMINPNIVGGMSKQAPVDTNFSGMVHPYFIVGLTDRLSDFGNANRAISARGALRHPQVVESGFQALLDKHKLPLIEAHLQWFKDYKSSELMKHKNPDGLVQRTFYTIRPVFEKGTTYIDIAHAHVHKVGHTTLTLKNNQGVMPRGYGHICDAWTTLDIYRRDILGDFNPDFRRAIEKTYVKHANMNYKYWDDGGFYKSYLNMGGYDAFLKARAAYEKEYQSLVKQYTGDELTNATGKAMDKLYDYADSRIFWAEIWAQRMMDINSVLPAPYVSMVEGVFARGDNGTELLNFITVGRNSTSVDSATSWLMGQDPRELPYTRIANERGLGENNIEKIPLFSLSEKGVEKIADYRTVERGKLGIYNYGLNDLGLRYF